MLDWLRNRLLAGAQPRCPNPGCGSADLIGVWLVMRPTPGKPWKTRPVGVRGTCNNCGLLYSVTVDGVKPHFVVAGGPAASGGSPSQTLGALVGDEAMPSYRGV